MTELRAVLPPDCMSRCIAVPVFWIRHQGCQSLNAQAIVRILRRKVYLSMIDLPVNFTLEQILSDLQKEIMCRFPFSHLCFGGIFFGGGEGRGVDSLLASKMILRTVQTF